MSSQQQSPQLHIDARAPAASSERAPIVCETGFKRYTLSGLIAADKGSIQYTKNEAFLLQVFWEVPSLAAAQKLLTALQICAKTTHQITPCTPTYFFRLASIDAEFVQPLPQTAGEHAHLVAAHKKLAAGVSIHAVKFDLGLKGIDPALLDLKSDQLLPEEMRAESAQHVRIEATEIYLDEQAFMEHAGSKEYLAAYGTATSPALTHGKPVTLAFGRPSAMIQQRILEPILGAQMTPVVQGCTLWRQRQDGDPEEVESECEPDCNVPVCLTLDVARPTDATNDETAATQISAIIPSRFRARCSTLLVFAHPLRADSVRIQCILSRLPCREQLQELASALKPVRGAVHCGTSLGTEDASALARLAQSRAAVHARLRESGLSVLASHEERSDSVGYVLHQLERTLRQRE